MRALNDKIDETFNWFTKAELSKYEVEYVSIVDSKVLGADEYPEEAYKIAKKKYRDNEVD